MKKTNKILTFVLLLVLALAIIPVFGDEGDLDPIHSNVEPGADYYAVSFITDDGTAIARKLVAAGTMTLPEPPERVGWEFVSWDVEGTAVSGEITVDRDMTVTAVYSQLSVAAEILYVYEKDGDEISFDSYSVSLTLADTEKGSVSVNSPESYELENGTVLLPDLAKVNITSEELLKAIASGEKRLSYKVMYGAADLSYTLVSMLGSLDSDSWEEADRSEYSGRKGSEALVPEKTDFGFLVNVENGTLLEDGQVVTAYYEAATELMSVNGSKTWNDGGSHPESITIRLQADGVEISEITVNEADDNWSWSFTDLPKYDDDGNEIEYTITEDAVDGYESTVEGYNVTNTELTSVSGSKIWKDSGEHPSRIMIRLMNGTNEVDNRIVSEADDNWSWTFANLPKYDSDGNEIEYEIAEDPVAGYGQTIEGFSVINTELIDLTVNIIWADGGLSENRPESGVTVQLLADDEPYGTPVTVTSGEDGDIWSHTWEDLPKYGDSGEIVYTAMQTAVENYTTSYSDNKLVITNTLSQDLPVKVVWEDEWNREGFRPTTITIQLLKNGSVEMELPFSGGSIASEWNLSAFTGLPLFDENGSEITYTVNEILPEPVIEAGAYNTSGPEENEDGGVTFTNSREVEMVNILLKKVWQDDDNKANMRPETVSFVLDHNMDDWDPWGAIFGEDDGWENPILGAQKYHHGAEVRYRCSEYEVPEGYAVSLYSVSSDVVVDSGSKFPGHYDYVFSITNTLSGVMDLTVTKRWEDNNDSDGIRPDSITVRLWRDGEEYRSGEVHGSGNFWYYTFEKLPMYAQNGRMIAYTVTEDPVEGYETIIEYNYIRNIHEPVYTTTVYYRYLPDGSSAAPAVAEEHKAGEHYEIVSPEISGYQATMEVVSGTQPARNIEVVVYYYRSAVLDDANDNYVPFETSIIDEYGTALGLGDVARGAGETFE